MNGSTSIIAKHKNTTIKLCYCRKESEMLWADLESITKLNSKLPGLNLVEMREANIKK